MYVEGGETSVISRGELSSLEEHGMEMPTDESEMLVFFKVHATEVLNNGKRSGVAIFRAPYNSLNILTSILVKSGSSETAVDTGRLCDA